VPDRIWRRQLFHEIASLFAQRATCERAQVGCVIISKDWHILSHGYNGAPSGQRHCIDGGCQIGPEGGCTRTLHAEANAIARAADLGISLRGSTLFSTHEPCLRCAMLIHQAGISKVSYGLPYREGASGNLVTFGITVDHFRGQDHESKAL
jgi:dCMP deaminase